MDFVGTGKRLAPNDIGDVARIFDVETAVLLAFLEVEASGRGFDNRKRLKMLRETHVFWKQLGPGPKRKKAAAQGLANPRWIKNYSGDSYPDLEKMMEIDRNAALRSCSWGLPQIMGFNHAGAGFNDAESMIENMKKGEREQLLAFVKLLESWDMKPMLTGKDFTQPASWKQAASKYNGTGYAAHNYHGKMAAAYRKHKGKTQSPVNGGKIAKDDEALHFGMRGELVLNLQNDLTALGYEFKAGIDGRFGNETKAHVVAFQRSQNLNPDGVVEEQTKAALRRAIAALGAIVDHGPVQRSENTPDAPITKSGRFWRWLTTGGAAAILPFGESIDWRVQITLIILIVGVSIYAIVKLPQIRKRIQDYFA
jgi:peptidoglycan hydrolase-like protein with peptidoglycan-binding domain